MILFFVCFQGPPSAAVVEAELTRVMAQYGNVRSTPVDGEPMTVDTSGPTTGKRGERKSGDSFPVKKNAVSVEEMTVQDLDSDGSEFDDDESEMSDNLDGDGLDFEDDESEMSEDPDDAWELQGEEDREEMHEEHTPQGRNFRK